MRIGARMDDAAMALGVQTSSPSGRGSSGRAQIQEVKYQIEKWNSLGKRLGYHTLLRRREQSRGILYDV